MKRKFKSPGQSAYAARAFIGMATEACPGNHLVADVARRVFDLAQLADLKGQCPYFTVSFLTRLRGRQHRNTVRGIVKRMIAAGVILVGRSPGQRAAAQAAATAGEQAPGFDPRIHKTLFLVNWTKLWAWAGTWKPFTPKATGPTKAAHLGHQATYAVERVERHHKAMIAAGEAEQARTRPELDREAIDESARQRLPLGMQIRLGLLKRSLNQGGAGPPPDSSGPGQSV